jgi:probable HAF family extracellular repeat protein
MYGFDVRGIGFCVALATFGVVGCGGAAEGPDAQENSSVERADLACSADSFWYRVTDLGSLSTDPGDVYIVARKVNERRQVVGVSDFKPFFWQNGRMTELATLGGSSSGAYGINDAGLIVGVSAVAGDLSNRAVTWQNGSIRDLGTLGGRHSSAIDVNSRGQIAGYSTLSEDDDLVSHAFLYTGGVMRDLGTLGGDSSYAYAMNDRGHVVGVSYGPTGGGELAAYWHDGVVEALAGMDTVGHAWDINDKDEIVGDVGNGIPRAFVYKGGVFTDIGSPGEVTSAVAINNRGVIVGYTSHQEPERPDLAGPEGFVLVGERLELLRNLVDSCWDVIQPLDINDRGQIVAVAYACEGVLKRHGLLLDRVPGCAGAD